MRRVDPLPTRNKRERTVSRATPRRGAARIDKVVRQGPNPDGVSKSIQGKGAAMQTQKTGAVGIDISKASFDVVWEGEHREFANDSKGCKRLGKWLKTGKPKGVCMEMTGQWWKNLAKYLYGEGIRVYVINPYRIKKFRDYHLHMNKTDKTDAALIAEFCEKEEKMLRPWEKPTEAEEHLQSVKRRMDALQKMWDQENSRLTSGESDPMVLEGIREHIAYLQEQIKAYHKVLQEAVKVDPVLKAKQKLLKSIVGFGDLTAARILVEIRNIDDFECAADVAAYAGLNPVQFVSGSSIHKKGKMSKQGKAILRKNLYFPAVVAMRYNPIAIDLKRRMMETGHTNKQIIVAVMKKLLQLAYGVLKSGKPFDPNYGKQFCYNP